MELQISNENERFDPFFLYFCDSFYQRHLFFLITYMPWGQRYKKFIPSLQFAYNRIAECVLFAPLLLQRLESAALPSGHEPL